MNCFRSLYLWVDLQPVFRRLSFRSRCELLSFFVPLGWFTANWLYRYHCHRLWIAFVLCTFGLIYSGGEPNSKRPDVVNCFRSLYLWVDLQRTQSQEQRLLCCELLSFFVPLGWFTAGHQDMKRSVMLWIAFVLCTFGLIYSWCKVKQSKAMLWIAFVLCTFGLIYSSQ